MFGLLLFLDMFYGSVSISQLTFSLHSTGSSPFVRSHAYNFSLEIEVLHDGIAFSDHGSKG
jgi:hypothetical protein